VLVLKLQERCTFDKLCVLVKLTALYSDDWLFTVLVLLFLLAETLLCMLNPLVKVLAFMSRSAILRMSAVPVLKFNGVYECVCE
jgi:hypothetical protein